MLALAVALLAGCSSPADGGRGASGGPPRAPGTESSASSSAFAFAAAPEPDGRHCLGPWTGSGSLQTYPLVAVDGEDNVPPVRVPDGGIRVAVWLNATPPHEGRGSFKPTDQAWFPLQDRTVKFNLTGDPAHGEADLPAATYDFGFNPDAGLQPETIGWTVLIREIPRPGRAPCG
jgi:hypothetical protein